VKDFSTAVGMEPALVIPFDPDAFFEAANDGKMLTDVKSAGATVNGLTYIANRLKSGSFVGTPDLTGKRKGKKTKQAKVKSTDGGEKKSLFSKLKKGK